MFALLDSNLTRGMLTSTEHDRQDHRVENRHFAAKCSKLAEVIASFDLQENVLLSRSGLWSFEQLLCLENVLFLFLENANNILFN